MKIKGIAVASAVVIIIIVATAGAGAYISMSGGEGGENQVPQQGKKAPAEFEVSNLSLSSSKVKQGESVDVSVDVSNVGDLPGEYTVDLKIDGAIENTKTTTLNGGESTTVTFTVKRETKKSYSVEIGNLSGNFEVVQKNDSEPDSDVSWSVWVGLSPVSEGKENYEVGDEIGFSQSIESYGLILADYHGTLVYPDGDNIVISDEIRKVDGSLTATHYLDIDKDTIEGTYTLSFTVSAYETEEGGPIGGEEAYKGEKIGTKKTVYSFKLEKIKENIYQRN